MLSALLLLLGAMLVPQDPAAKPAPKPADEKLTGAVSEEEFKKMHELTEEKAPPAKGVEVTLASGEKAYLSLPEGKKAPFPALIVIHEWWGLNDHIRHWSDRLAAAGYAALAVDLYGGKAATTRDEAMKLMRAVDDDTAAKTLQAAHDFLVTDERVTASKTGAIGWCFGGAKSLQAALAIKELDACVLYYGRLVTDPERLKAIDAAVCGVFGNEDQSIPPAVVDEFDAALTTAEVEHEIHRYDAPHAFANPSSPAYHEKEAADAWEKVRAFLEKKLK